MRSLSRSRPVPSATALAFLIGLALAASGCAKGTYLQVNVTGAGIPAIHELRIALIVTPPGDGGQVLQSEGPVGNGTSPITLPTSFAFKLDSESGDLVVSARALDVSGKVIATASTSTTIMHAQTWTIMLNLVPS